MGRLLLFSASPFLKQESWHHLVLCFSLSAQGNVWNTQEFACAFLRVTDTHLDQNLTLFLLQDLDTLSMFWDALLFGFPWRNKGGFQPQDRNIPGRCASSKYPPKAYYPTEEMHVELWLWISEPSSGFSTFSFLPLVRQRWFLEKRGDAAERKVFPKGRIFFLPVGKKNYWNKSLFFPSLHLYIGRQAANPLTYCNTVQQRRQYNNNKREFSVLHTLPASLGVTMSNVLSLFISYFQTYWSAWKER